MQPLPMTEEQADQLHEIKEEFYIEFSKLVARTLAKLPPSREYEVLYTLQEKTSVWGSCYKKYLPEYRKLADDPAFK